MNGGVRAGKRVLSRDDVVAAAERVLDTHGWDAVTITAVAEELGVRSSNLYNHVAGLDDIRAELQRRVFDDLGRAMRDVVLGRSRNDALRGAARVYRQFATAHPGRYSAMSRIVPGDGSGDDDPREHVAIQTIRAVIAGFGLDETALGQAEMTLWSMIHGFVSLEITGVLAHAADPEEAFERTLDGLELLIEMFMTTTPTTTPAIAMAGSHQEQT